MSDRLSGKVAIVTGAGQTPGATVGNGRACATRFAVEGAAVACVDRDLVRAEETVAEILAAGGQAIAIGSDVTSEDACASFIDDTVAAFGGVDILHNNVGGLRRRRP